MLLTLLMPVIILWTFYHGVALLRQRSGQHCSPGTGAGVVPAPVYQAFSLFPLLSYSPLSLDRQQPQLYFVLASFPFSAPLLHHPPSQDDALDDRQQPLIRFDDGLPGACADGSSRPGRQCDPEAPRTGPDDLHATDGERTDPHRGRGADGRSVVDRVDSRTLTSELTSVVANATPCIVCKSPSGPSQWGHGFRERPPLRTAVLLSLSSSSD